MAETNIVLFVWGNTNDKKKENPYQFRVCVEGNDLDFMLDELTSAVISFPQIHTINTYDNRVLIFCVHISTNVENDTKHIRFSFGETSKERVEISVEEFERWRKENNLNCTTTGRVNDHIECFQMKSDELDNVIKEYKTSAQMYENFKISKDEITNMGDSKWFHDVDEERSRKQNFFKLYKEYQKSKDRLNSYRRIEGNQTSTQVVSYKYLQSSGHVNPIQSDEETNRYTAAFKNHVGNELRKAAN